MPSDPVLPKVIAGWVSPSNGDLLERVVSTAQNHRLNPNGRCAFVTIALALLVCPERVHIDTEFGVKAKYRGIEIKLPEPDSVSAVNFQRVNAVDLAVFYSDCENNERAAELLKAYSLCESDEQRKTVLGLAWVCLVKGAGAFAHSFRGGHVIESKEFGLFLRQLKGRIVEAHFRPPKHVRSAKPEDWEDRDRVYFVRQRAEFWASTMRAGILKRRRRSSAPIVDAPSSPRAAKAVNWKREAEDGH